MVFRPGDRVVQAVYGAGDVVDRTRDHITISFDAGGIRKFAVRVVHLEPTTVARPSRPKPRGWSRSRRKPEPPSEPTA